MVRQLVQRPFAATPAALGANAQVSVSPNGKYVLVCNEAANPTLYQWDGTNYVVIANAVATAGKIAYSGAWSADGLFLLLQTDSTLQLRSFNDATGATAILDDTVAARAGATIRHFFDNHYVGIKTRTSTGVIAEWYKHDRTTNKLTRITSYTSGANSSIMAFAVLKNKKSLFIAWRNANGNSVRVCYFNESAGSYTFGTTSQLESGGSDVTGTPIDVAVSDDENYWFRVGNEQTTRNRAGTIAANGQSITVSDYDSAALGEAASLTAFIFGSKQVFRGKGDTGTAPFDTYNMFNNGVYSANVGEVIPMDNRTVGFARYYPSGSKDSSTTARKVWAFLSRTGGAPSVAVYREVVSNDTVTLVDIGPMGNAFTSLRKYESVQLIQVGPMGDAWASMLTDDSVRLSDIGPMGDAFVTTFEPQIIRALAVGPMGDAAFTTIGQHFINLAIAPMGDAWAWIPNENMTLVDSGPMGDAFVTTQEFSGVDVLAIAPMGDGLITFSPQWQFLEAVGPMGDASFDIPNVYVNALDATGPMGDATFDIPNVYFRSLFAVGPMGDATARFEKFPTVEAVAVAPMGDAFVSIRLNGTRFVDIGPMGDASFDIPNVYVEALDALGPMGEATVDIEVPKTGILEATGPMGDASIGLQDIDYTCRRRSMMIIQVF